MVQGVFKRISYRYVCSSTGSNFVSGGVSVVSLFTRVKNEKRITERKKGISND